MFIFAEKQEKHTENYVVSVIEQSLEESKTREDVSEIANNVHYFIDAVMDCVANIAYEKQTDTEVYVFKAFGGSDAIH